MSPQNKRNFNTHDDPDDVIQSSDFQDVQMVCPQCGSSEFAYVGEAYDEDEYQGSSYDCFDCHHQWTMVDD